MKKFLLPFILMLSVVCTGFAATYQYGYATDELDGLGTSMAGSNYAAAIKVPKEVAAQMVGSKVTAISVGFHSGVAKAVNVFVTKDLYGNSIVKQSGSVKAKKYTDIALSTPYVIDGEEFYIGYTYRQSTSTGTPIGVDKNTAGANECFDLIAAYPDGGSPEYEHIGTEYGALCLRAVIEGDNLPQNAALVSAVNLPTRSFPGDKINYSFTVRNMGVQPLASAKITSVFADEAPITDTYTFATPLAPGETATFNFQGSSDIDTMSLPVSATLTEANGQTNPWAFSTTVNHMINSETVTNRVPVFEEFTGTGCGYCPVGWLATEAMRERHPNDCIVICVHLYNSTDPMYVPSYTEWAAANITGAPQATCNRSRTIRNFSPSIGSCESYYEEISREISPVSARIWAKYTDDKKQTVDTRVAVTAGDYLDNLNYGIAWVVTRDNMGPYNQANNYAGMKVDMGGFENKSSYTPLMFNDVARNILYWNGMNGSVPAKINRGDASWKDLTLPLGPDSDDPSVHSDLNIIALVVDRNTGEIVTGAKCKIGDYLPEAGIGYVYDGSAPADIFATEGGIAIMGDVELAQVFNLEGMCLTTSRQAGVISLPAGLYIVKATAAGKTTTAKVAVK